MKDGFSQFKKLEKQLFGQKSSRENMCKLFGISSSTYFKMQREDKLNAKVLAHCKTLNTMPLGLLNVVAENHGIELNE